MKIFFLIALAMVSATSRAQEPNRAEAREYFKIAPQVSDLSNTPCLTGSRSERRELAIQALQAITDEEIGTVLGKKLTELSIKAIPGETKKPDAYKAIQTAISNVKTGCLFSLKARFETVEDAIDAMSEHAFLVNQTQNTLPIWLRPWFKAVLEGTDDSTRYYLIETRPEGFYFRSCTKLEGEKAKCVPFGNKYVSVPVNDLMHAGSGVGHVLLATLKSIGALTVVATTHFSIGYFIPNISSIISNVLNPKPLEAIQNDHRISKTMRKMIEIMKTSPDIENKRFVDTKIVPYPFDQIGLSIKHLQAQSFKKMCRKYDREFKRSPNNPSLRNSPCYKVEIGLQHDVSEHYDQFIPNDEPYLQQTK